ncbi:MAG: hypothetical protein K2M73_07970 [Lachnospiraceae bacterium]|nr:hypothetical protein [Lachnospiraceae bacterium]
MKIFSLVLMLLVSALVVGCSLQPTRLVKEKEVVYVGIPIPCEVPEVICDFSGDWLEPTEKLMKCISEQKRIIGICSGKLPDTDDIVKSSYQVLGNITVEEEVDADITK